MAAVALTWQLDRVCSLFFCCCLNSTLDGSRDGITRAHTKHRMRPKLNHKQFFPSLQANSHYCRFASSCSRLFFHPPSDCTFSSLSFLYKVALQRYSFLSSHKQIEFISRIAKCRKPTEKEQRQLRDSATHAFHPRVREHCFLRSHIFYPGIILFLFGLSFHFPPQRQLLPIKYS